MKKLSFLFALALGLMAIFLSSGAVFALNPQPEPPGVVQTNPGEASQPALYDVRSGQGNFTCPPRIIVAAVPSQRSFDEANVRSETSAVNPPLMGGLKIICLFDQE